MPISAMFCCHNPWRGNKYVVIKHNMKAERKPQLIFQYLIEASCRQFRGSQVPSILNRQSYLQYYSQYFNSKCCTHLSSTQFSSLGPRHSASVWSQVCQVGSRLISYKFTTHLTFSSGLTYVTVLVRSNEGQSSWFCYLICLQLLVNWVQFLLHRSDPKVYKVLTFNSIYFNRSFVPLSNDNYPGYVHMWVEWWYMIQGA